MSVPHVLKSSTKPTAPSPPAKLTEAMKLPRLTVSFTLKSTNDLQLKLTGHFVDHGWNGHQVTVSTLWTPNAHADPRCTKTMEGPTFSKGKKSCARPSSGSSVSSCRDQEALNKTPKYASTYCYVLSHDLTNRVVSPSKLHIIKVTHLQPAAHRCMIYYQRLSRTKVLTPRIPGYKAGHW